MARKKIAARAARKKAGPKLVQRAEAAAFFGVEPTRINKWVADGAPVARKGARGHAALYDLGALRKWREARQDVRASGLSLEEERAKLAKAQTEKTEMENRVRSGALVERQQVVDEGCTFVRASMTRLLQVPRQASQVGLIPRDRETELRRLISEALRELSAWRAVEDLAETA